MNTKYGQLSSTQITSTISQLRKTIFFLLLCVDPNTKDDYPNVDVVGAIHSLQLKLNGLNSILQEPPELVGVMSLIESALNEYLREDFNYAVYRKLILDAGSEILRIGGD